MKSIRFIPFRGFVGVFKIIMSLNCFLYTELFSEESNNHFVSPEDNKIQYTGRIDFQEPSAPVFSFPGVSISCRFYGTSISAAIIDFSYDSLKNTNYFNVFIDGVLVKKIQVNKLTKHYVLSEGLPKEEHTLLLTKRTESFVGKCAFKGFYIEGDTLLNLPENPVRKIEFIGDSWTCGYGNVYSGPGANTGFTSVNEDNYMAWGAITSRKLNAQYHCTAYSGRGMYRNNTGDTVGTLPELYLKTLPDDADSKWDPNNYIPDVIVIHLGSNDLFSEQWKESSMLDSAAYVSAYVNFVTQLKVYYPKAKIVCAFGSSHTDSWPIGKWNLTRWRIYIQAVCSFRKNMGDNDIFFFELKKQEAPYGENWHPAIHEHIRMADQISPFIEQITSWH